jgi:gamma-glutamylputrescine oxidase
MTISYWHIKNESLRRKRDPEPHYDRSCDIAVIGGGLMGIAVAYFLRSFGCEKVIVLEKEFVGYGASGRNAGFLLAGMAESYSRLVVGMGHDSAKSLMQATMENHDLIAQAIEINNIRCEYCRSGSFHLSLSNVENRELIDSVELLARDRFKAEYFDKSGIKNKLGFGEYAGGFYFPLDGSLDPFAFVNSLGIGIEIIEGFEVQEIRRADGIVEILGPKGAVKSEMAVLATNAYSPLLDNHFKELVFPVRGQMLATAQLKNHSPRIAPSYANFGYDYFRQLSDDTILMGGLRDRFAATEVGQDDITTPSLQAELEEYMHNKLGINKFDVACRWSGAMGNTIDGLPLVGPLPHNNAVIAAVGCNGHGFGLWMVVARDLARAIMKNETSDLLRRFSIKRFLR